MKKKAKTQKTKTAATKAKATKASTTSKAVRGAKPTTGKAPRSSATATAERKQSKRGARKPDTTIAEHAVTNPQPEVPEKPAIAAAADESPSPAPSPSTEAGPAAADARKPAADATEVATPEGAPPAEKPTASDSRLPPVGTVLQKRDRHGAVRCECEVTAEGIRYQDNLYRSLSAAAVAAARELGLAAKAINGFTFWGLAKPARPAADPLAALERAWERYASKVESVLESAKGSREGRQDVLGALQRHARVLKNLHDEVA